MSERPRPPAGWEDAAPLPDRLFERFLPEVDHRTVGEILAHPDFARMRHRYVPDTMANSAMDVFPGGWRSAAYRTAAIGTVVCLWVAHDAADRATWPTLTRFKQAVSALGLQSARQIDDFVGRLVETGNVVLERAAADGRVRLLRPTEKLLAWDRAMFGPYYEALQTLYPEPGYGPAVARDPDFQIAVRGSSLEIFPVIGTFLHENVDLVPFYNMYQGLHVLMILAVRRATDPGIPARERDFMDIQNIFGVSRSQIRNIVGAAEAAGLVAWVGGNRKSFVATPRGLAAVDLYIANTLACHDLIYRLALTRMGRDPGAPAR